MSESASEQVHVNLQAVADIVGGRVSGDPSVVVEGVAPVDQAGPRELGFLANRSYVRFVASSQAGALLTHPPLVERLPEGAPIPMVIVDDPHVALRLLLRHFYPEAERRTGIHPTAVIGESVSMGRGCAIGPYVVVEDGAQLGSGVSIGAHAVVGAGCVVGKESVLHPHVVLYAGVRVGTSVIIHSGARIGVDGFGYVYENGAHQKVPQVGRCVIEDHVEIGANTCIDRGSIGSTRIGSGTKIDNQVHIAHNVDVGEQSLLVAQVGIAGSSRVGKGAQLGGQVGVSGHLSVGDGARLGAQAGVIGDVPAGATFWGTPARPRIETLRRLANMGKVEELARRIKALEAEGNAKPNP